MTAETLEKRGVVRLWFEGDDAEDAEEVDLYRDPRRKSVVDEMVEEFCEDDYENNGARSRENNERVVMVQVLDAAPVRYTVHLDWSPTFTVAKREPDTEESPT